MADVSSITQAGSGDAGPPAPSRTIGSNRNIGGTDVTRSKDLEKPEGRPSTVARSAPNPNKKGLRVREAFLGRKLPKLRSAYPIGFIV